MICMHVMSTLRQCVMIRLLLQLNDEDDDKNGDGRL